MAIGNFLGGFADAFVKTSQSLKQQQEREEMAKLQKKAMNAQFDLQEKQRNAREQFAYAMNPEGPGTQPQTLLDLLSTPEGGALAVQSGMDIGSLVKQTRLAQSQNAFNDLIARMTGGNAPVGATQGATQMPTGGAPTQTQMPGGGVLDPRKIDPLSLIAAQQSGDFSKVKLSPLAEPLSPAEIAKIPGAKPGMSMLDVQDLGLTTQPESELKIEQKLRTANQLFTDLSNVVDRVFTGENFGERSGQAFEATKQNVMRENPDYVYIMDFESKLAPLVKSLGETGALAQEDIERAKKLIPRLFPIPDSKKVARSKMKELKRLIDSAIKKDQQLSGGSNGAMTKAEKDRLQQLDQELGL